MLQITNSICNLWGCRVILTETGHIARDNRTQEDLLDLAVEGVKYVNEWFTYITNEGIKMEGLLDPYHPRVIRDEEKHLIYIDVFVRCRSLDCDNKERLAKELFWGFYNWIKTLENFDVDVDDEPSRVAYQYLKWY